jgi:hypothetical protein
MKDVKVEDIAKDVSKIDEQELKAVQAKIQQINQAQMQVGGLEVQKDMALEVLKAGQQELQVLQKTLEDKYGKVSINLTDGTIRDIEDEADKKD